MDEALKRKLSRAADIIEIQQLQSKYMIALDEMNFAKILNDYMAKDHPEVSYEMVENGVYKGPEQVKAFLTVVQGRQGNIGKRGYFPMMTLRTPCIVLNKEGTRARGQWHLIGPHVMDVTPYPGNKHKLTAYWFFGKYDNEYIKIDGVWKILKLHVINFVRTPWEYGWLKQPDCRRVITPENVRPSQPSLIHTYHPDAVYTSDGPYNWGPFLSDGGDGKEF